MTESSYIKGSRLLHNPAEDEGLNLSFMGIPSESMATWNHLQGMFDGNQTPCYSRPEWLSNRAADKRTAIRLCGDCPAKHACREFAEANNESFGIWGGHDFSKGKP